MMLKHEGEQMLCAVANMLGKLSATPAGVEQHSSRASSAGERPQRKAGFAWRAAAHLSIVRGKDLIVTRSCWFGKLGCTGREPCQDSGMQSTAAEA